MKKKTNAKTMMKDMDIITAYFKKIAGLLDKNDIVKYQEKHEEYSMFVEKNIKPINIEPEYIKSYRRQKKLEMKLFDYSLFWAIVGTLFGISVITPSYIIGITSLVGIIILFIIWVAKYVMTVSIHCN